ncbi:hypothetical protein OIU77_006208 [Salix suchowensis]|uniref:PPM-type phosphatase domain-containing protein n=1 Tax=Salix suchowensis TaxID=1278906 RepID=A0ABQ9AK09_9ROSI|nr:hypothetical protein OIU77_006208 [Salix suchowensis]
MGSCLSAESRSPRPGTPSSPGFGVRKRKNSKKRPGSRNSSFDYRREEPLHRIPGRLFLNGSSDIASLFTQQGKKGTNQDAMIVWELPFLPLEEIYYWTCIKFCSPPLLKVNFASRTDTVFCGVFDGHGPYGHMVAKRVRDSLPLKLTAHWEVNITSEDVLREISLNTTGSMNSEDISFISADDESRAAVDLEDAEKHPEIFQTLKESFLKAFKVMDRELRMHTNIDCFCSGTTAVTLVKQGQYLVIGNVGDSRAVLGTRDKDDFLFAVQLTVDLKPNLPAEAERIRKCKGRVFSLRDEPEVARVWLPNNDSPGLAMARAFGDFCLKDFGLISVPDVSYRRLTDKDEFIVLATDGIWDVLSNKEVVEIVASVPLRSSAAKAVVETAVRAWRLTVAGRKEDDLSGPTGVDRAGTTRAEKEALLGGDAEEEDASGQDEMQSEYGIEWSALEGVSRVNTLLNLPRFVPGKEGKKPPK